jgi:hypothetical protein
MLACARAPGNASSPCFSLRRSWHRSRRSTRQPPSPARSAAIAYAIAKAVLIMRKVDHLYPSAG